MKPLRNLLLILFLLLLSAPLQAQETTPPKPGKGERCPVCGMFVAPYPDWIASMQFRDGSWLFFDGAKDLLRYYFSLPNKNDPRSHADIVQLYVTDYYSTRPVAASEVYYVLGSDVNGPMGAELIPVKGKAAAESFLVDHHGKKILSFSELSADRLPRE